MKRFIIALMALVMTTGIASAQNYMVVDSEKVFKSIAAYNEALQEIETTASAYQKAVDAKFAEVEKLYNNYMQQRSSLSAVARQQNEELILKREAEAIAGEADNVVANAPHTAAELAGEWNHPYSRQQAVFPLEWVGVSKFFPYVSKIDNGYGDRNLVAVNKE